MNFLFLPIILLCRMFKWPTMKKTNPSSTRARSYLPHHFSVPLKIDFDVSVPLCNHCWFAPSWGNTQDPCLPRRASLDTHRVALYGDQDIQKGYERLMFCLDPRVLKCKRMSVINTEGNTNKYLYNTFFLMRLFLYLLKLYSE